VAHRSRRPPPAARRLEAYRLADGARQASGPFGGNRPAQIAPFDAAAVDLGALWGEAERG
jgi:hypothetical protein